MRIYLYIDILYFIPGSDPIEKHLLLSTAVFGDGALDQHHLHILLSLLDACFLSCITQGLV